MTRSSPQTHLTLITPPAETAEVSLADAVKAGLTAPTKQLPCRFFYDRPGSALFEEICRLPEYYIPRAEQEILAARAAEIVGLFPEAITMVELGCGNAAKTRLLIGEALRQHGALRYVPVDISRAMLEETCGALLRDYPALEVVAVAGEYEAGVFLLELVVA